MQRFVTVRSQIRETCLAWTSDISGENASRTTSWAACALLFSAFASGFSMPLGRALLALSTVLAVTAALRGELRMRWPPAAWLAVAYLLVAIETTALGANPAKGVSNLSKLLWYAGIPIAASLARTPRARRRLLGALVWGTAVLAVRVVPWNMLQAWREAASGMQPTFTAALIDRGSLTHAQQLMLGLIGAVGLSLGATGGPARLRQSHAHRFIPIVMTALGLLIALKRGPWLCAAAALAALLAPRFGWRRLAPIALLLLAAALSIPAVRVRVVDLPREFTHARGGRWAMWTEVAPGLLRDYPHGIGFRSLTNDLMRQYVPHIERNRNHLHSNLVEALTSTGPLGLLLYLAWMLCSIRDAARLRNNDARRDPGDHSGAILLWMLAALLLNGLVEYNFADGEIVLMLGLMMGLAAGERKKAAD